VRGKGKINKAKVLLINPGISGDARYGKFKDVGSYLPPYGLLSIAAVLEEHGCIIKVIDADARVPLSDNEIKNIISNFQPNIIGITAYSIGRNQLIELANSIRTYSSALIVTGGPHVISLPDDLAEYDCFDMLVYGEGEYVMLDIARYSIDEESIENIDGIMYRKDGEVIKNRPRAYIQDLDTLPYPAFHLLDNLFDYRPMQLLYKKPPVLTLIVGRGCPFECIFCKPIWGRSVRLNSAEYIMGLVKKVVADYGIREILFYEDSFCLSKERVMDLCDMLIEADMGLIWSCSANVRTLDKETLGKMKEAGCWLISVGIESGNDEVLKFINKPVTVEEVRLVCAWANDIGMKVRGFFMLGHPIDTKETIKQTIDFALELPLHTVNFCIMTLMPGTKARQIAHKYGKVNYDYSLGTGHPGETLSFVPEGLTSEYLSKMQRKAYKSFFVRPVQAWRLLKGVDSVEDIKKYWKLCVAFVKLYL